MANSLGIRLHGKIVVMEGNGPESDRIVKVEDGSDAGFGANPEAMGKALYVRRVRDGQVVGEAFRMNAWEVEKLLEN